MKKLLLTLGLMLSANAWADMDKICQVEFDDPFMVEHKEFIEKNCERNNILLMKKIPLYRLAGHTALYCRQDREINVYDSGLINDEGLYRLVCVLYDNKMRNLIKEGQNLKAKLPNNVTVFKALPNLEEVSVGVQ